MEEALSKDLTWLSRHIEVYKKKDRSDKKTAATTNWLLYNANRGEKSKALGLEDFMPWPMNGKNNTFLRGLLSTTEILEIEEAIDNKLITGIAKIRLELELGVL